MKIIDDHKLGLVIYGTKRGMLGFVWNNILDKNANEYNEDGTGFFKGLSDPRSTTKFSYIGRELFAYSYEIKEFETTSGKKHYLFYTIYQPIHDWSLFFQYNNLPNVFEFDVKVKVHGSPKIRI